MGEINKSSMNNKDVMAFMDEVSLSVEKAHLVFIKVKYFPTYLTFILKFLFEPVTHFCHYDCPY